MKTKFAWAFCMTPFLGGVLATTAGCAGPPPVPPVTTVQSAPVAPAPLVAPVVAVSPNVSVSQELVAACKLHLDNAESAPKFGFDASELGSDDDAILSQVAACVTTGPLASRSLALVGRADPRGGDTYNMALGDRRASTVRAHLVGLGVDTGKIEGMSRGELDATGTDEGGWRRDRRVDILLR